MENDWTKVLGFPGYRVYQQEIDEEHQQGMPGAPWKVTAPL
jgi:hypothetical protein